MVGDWAPSSAEDAPDGIRGGDNRVGAADAFDLAAREHALAVHVEQLVLERGRAEVGNENVHVEFRVGTAERSVGQSAWGQISMSAAGPLLRPYVHRSDSAALRLACACFW